MKYRWGHQASNYFDHNAREVRRLPRGPELPDVVEFEDGGGYIVEERPMSAEEREMFRARGWYGV